MFNVDVVCLEMVESWNLKNDYKFIGKLTLGDSMDL